MSAISETYSRAHNFLEFASILPNVSFTTSEKERGISNLSLPKCF